MYLSRCVYQRALERSPARARGRHKRMALPFREGHATRRGPSRLLLGLTLACLISPAIPALPASDSRLPRAGGNPHFARAARVVIAASTLLPWLSAPLWQGLTHTLCPRPGGQTAAGPWDVQVNLVPRCLQAGDPAECDGRPTMGNLPLGGLKSGIRNYASGTYDQDVGIDAKTGFDIDTVQPPRLPPLHPPRLRRRHGRADATSKYGGDVKKSIFGKAAGQQAVMSTPEGAQAAVAAAGTCQAD